MVSSDFLEFASVMAIFNKNIDQKVYFILKKLWWAYSRGSDKKTFKYTIDDSWIYTGLRFDLNVCDSLFTKDLEYS